MDKNLKDRPEDKLAVRREDTDTLLWQDLLDQLLDCRDLIAS
jgi:hypothetical protein